MYLADYHTHTTISSDAVTTLPQLCRAAEAAGLSEVCITDHWNLVTQQGERMPGPFDWTASLAQWKRCRTRFSGRVELRLGLEVGNGLLDPGAVAETLSLPQLDFAIGSLHNMSPRYHDMGTYTAAHQVKSREEAVALLEDYMATLEALAASEGYDVLGHIIYPLRYLPAEYGLSLDPWWDRLAALLKAVIQRGKGMEVNTTQGQTVEDWIPYLKLYKELGGEILTFGSDAHRPHQVGRSLREAQELARQAGFRWQTTYKRRVPFFTPL